jgi:predicted dithiol-disulfide oxidoreductase (DUF899 family)
MNTTTSPRIVPRDDWLVERLALLAREKELTRLHDELARLRRQLPWVRVDKRYVFDTPQGPRGLSELFDGRRQLLVQHFMFAPGWDEGCKSCSFMADHHDGMLAHLAQRDVALRVVSRAPLEQIEAFRRRMGWTFGWVSSHGSDFNRDFGVSFTAEQMARAAVPYNYKLQAFPSEEAPGISVFARDDAGTVFHTYSRYGRGVEVMMGTYALLDLMPRGRDEGALAYGMEWLRHHDRYESAAPVAAGGCCTGRS